MEEEEEIIDDEDIDDEVLISLVQANSCLYSKKDKNFKNYDLKETKWEEIADTLNYTVDEVKKRWDSLRNQLSRKLRILKTHPPGTILEWPFVSRMSFLIPHIQKRKSRTTNALFKQAVVHSSNLGKRKAIEERHKDTFEKLSQAVDDLTAAYKKRKIEEKKKLLDPKTAAIAQALETVAPEKQSSCLIAVLQLIEKFKK